MVKPGWYAVTLCWDIEEGVFPDAHYSAGDFEHHMGFRSPEPFATEAEAKEWARAHDVDVHGYDGWVEVDD